MDEKKLNINSAAAQGFQAGAETYERGRPDFPAEAVEFLIQTLNINWGSHVLDLAAGTGKLTRRLVPTGAKLTTVEGMRRKFSTLLPDIQILKGTAEATKGINSPSCTEPSRRGVRLGRIRSI